MALCSFVTKGVVVAHVVVVRYEVDSSHAKSSDEMVGVHPVPLLDERLVGCILSGLWFRLSVHTDSSDKPKGADVLYDTQDNDWKGRLWFIKSLVLLDLSGDSSQSNESSQNQEVISSADRAAAAAVDLWRNEHWCLLHDNSGVSSSWSWIWLGCSISIDWSWLSLGRWLHHLNILYLKNNYNFV